MGWTAASGVLDQGWASLPLNTDGAERWGDCQRGTETFTDAGRARGEAE